MTIGRDDEYDQRSMKAGALNQNPLGHVNPKMKVEIRRIRGGEGFPGLGKTRLQS